MRYGEPSSGKGTTRLLWFSFWVLGCGNPPRDLLKHHRYIAFLAGCRPWSSCRGLNRPREFSCHVSTWGGGLLPRARSVDSTPLCPESGQDPPSNLGGPGHPPLQRLDTGSRALRSPKAGVQAEERLFGLFFWDTRALRQNSSDLSKDSSRRSPPTNERHRGAR